MYVSVPKNYSGMAFSRERNAAVHPDVVHPAVESEKPMPQRILPPPAETESKETHPILSLAHALKKRNGATPSGEDLLLIGLILLLLGKEGNEDVLLILAMLLLI